MLRAKLSVFLNYTSMLPYIMKRSKIKEFKSLAYCYVQLCFAVIIKPIGNQF